MEVSKSTDNSISRRGVFCGIALLAVGLTSEAAAAAVTAVGVTQVGKKIKLDLNTINHLDYKTKKFHQQMNLLEKIKHLPNEIETFG